MKIVLSVLFVTLLSTLSLSQVRPVYDQGVLGLGQTLERIANTKRIMHIGAHPDDEDSALLAYLARKEKARTVYLSLTRGDGGQNVIGPELFEALGIIRTEELLQARTLDGAKQMFTRAFDFGYSKTLKESRDFWDEEAIKCDVVRAIRQFKPQVVNPRFSGTPRDGHGHHQFAGYITPIAVKAAADPNECPNAGAPWKVSKFYIGRGFRSNKAPTLNLNTGLYDPLLGRTYYQIAVQGRSQHKTQEQGRTELYGDRFSGVNLISSDVEGPKKEKSMFDGLDTSWSALVSRPSAKRRLKRISSDYVAGLSKMGGYKPQEILQLLLRTHKRLVTLGKDKRLTAKDRSGIKNVVDEFEGAIKEASGVRILGASSDETVTDEEKFGVTVSAFVPKDIEVRLGKFYLDTPEGWNVEVGSKPKEDNSRFARFFRETPDFSESFDVTVPAFTPPTQPHFLEMPRENELYQTEFARNRNKPFQENLITAKVEIEVGGIPLVFETPVQYRFADDTRGELRRNLNVVPKVSVSMDQKLVVFGASRRPHRIAVNLVNLSKSALKGLLRLKSDDGILVKNSEREVSIEGKGRGTTLDFEIEVPEGTAIGEYSVRAEFEAGGRKFDHTLKTVAYDHIQTHRYYIPAKTKIVVSDVRSSDTKIGYVMGSGDSGPEALRQMGYEVALLGSKDLTNSDLSQFDTIVIGIRASETNPSYVANNSRLLDFVRKGGTMIVQYQKFAYQRLNLAPYPFSYNARVSDETAPVRILNPDHPVFNSPNKITSKDFEGWVQERNLYAFRTFDERYMPLLSSNDPGEDENKGGMVYAKYGEGHYMYVSYAFFRQLPAGVPGAYRLFSNVVSIGKN